MCGIAGLIFRTYQPSEVVYGRLSRMLQQIAHRGPNGCQILLSDGENYHKTASPQQLFSELPQALVAMGNCRLAITGINSVDSQPHYFKNKRCVTFNGEIYNFRQLVDLPQNASDSEAIIPLWNQLGVRLFEQLDGAWAIALFDNTTRRLILCRDRTGVKPLYYCLTSFGIAFASEEQALWAYTEHKAEVHFPTVEGFLRSNQLRSQNCGFVTGIQEVPPSHYVEIDLNNQQQNVVRYFTPTVADLYSQSEKQLIVTLRHLLDTSIRSRIPNSVSWGVCLSGGVDSSTIAALARCNSNRFTAFTAAVDVANCDESGDAAMVACHLGIPHEIVHCSSSDFVAQLPTIIKHQAMPIINAGTYLQWKVYDCASQLGIKVMLNGQGGDELFAGYAHSLAVYLCGLLKSGSYRKAVYELMSFKNWPIAAHQLFTQVVMRLPLKQEDTLSSHLLSLCFDGCLQDLLRWDDRCSMAHGIESRTPFADDNRLMDFALRVPDSYKVRNGFGKWILRESVGSYLPSSVVWKRRKLGLATPHQWFVEQKEFYRQIIHDKSSSELPFAHLLIKPTERWWKNPDTKISAQVFKQASLILWYGYYCAQMAEVHQKQYWHK